MLGEWAGERNSSEKPGTEASTRGGGHLETKVRTASLDPFVSNKIPFIK